MDRFELSERWCGWTDLDLIFTAARAAIEAGPFDPPICEVVFNEEFDPFTVDTFQEAREHMARHRVHSMEIILSHFDEDEARLTMHYACERLQLNGSGSDWDRARAATTPRRPCSPATSGSRRSSSRSCRATPSPRRASAS